MQSFGVAYPEAQGSPSLTDSSVCKQLNELPPQDRCLVVYELARIETMISHLPVYSECEYGKSFRGIW